MSRVLLIKEADLRESLAISDSINSKMLQTTIAECQDMYLSSIVGDTWLDFVYGEVAAGRSLSANDALLVEDYIQPFLRYKVASMLCAKVNYRVGNAGVISPTDANQQDPKRMIDYYDGLVGVALSRLTDYLRRHLSLYPRIQTWQHGIQAHIDATASTSIFLGGPCRKNYDNLP